MKKLLLIVIVLVILAFHSSTMATQYTVVHQDEENPPSMTMVSFSELGKYDIVDNNIGLENTIGEYAFIAPMKTFVRKVSYQYYYDVTEGVVKAEFVTNIKDEDQVSCAEVVNAKIWDTFKGVSGTTYILQEQTLLNEEQIRYLASQDIVVSGEWVEYSGDEDAGGSTQRPFYTTEGGVTVTYEYYLGYVPPPHPITETGQVIPGGWIVTYIEPIN